MVDNNNLELRLCISIPLHDSLETKTTIEFKAKKRVTISDYSCSSGNWTRTSDLRVMSPTSYLLLYPAICIFKEYGFNTNLLPLWAKPAM